MILQGVIKSGQVVLPHPAAVPDGTAVTVLTHGSTGTLGIPDDQWPTDPEGIALLVERMERVEPFEMSAAEEAEIAAWRQKVKEYTLVKQKEAGEGLFE